MRINRFNYFGSMEHALNKYKLKYGNNIRLVALKMILRNFKWLYRRFIQINCTFDDDKIHILFELDGGLGDIIIALNFLKNFNEKFSKNVVIDIVVPSNLYNEIKFITDNQSFISDCLIYTKGEYCGYDICINFVRIPVIKYLYNDEKIKNKSLELYNWLQHNKKFCYENEKYTHPGTISDGILSWYTLMRGQNRISQADVIKSVNVQDILKINLTHIHEVLSKFNLQNNQYIVLQNGAGLNSLSKNKSIFTRDWSNENFNVLVEKLKQIYPDYKVVQVGYPSQQNITGTNCNLLGKTNFHELLVIVGCAKLLISSESGVIHFRHFTTSKPSVVLFGPTRPEMFGYPENINIVSSICSGCEWMHPNWRTFCVKSNSEEALCLKDITATHILNKIKDNRLL